MDWIAYFCPKCGVLQQNSILYFVMLITLHPRTLYCAFFIYKRDLKSRRFSHNRSTYDTYDQQKRFHPTWRKQHFSVECEPFCFTKSDTQVDLRIVATTDIHSFLTDFDYYKDAPTEKFGFTRAAKLDSSSA